MTALHYRTYLKDELERRLAKNKRYSLRAFARDLAMNPGDLSKILSGKQPLTLKMADKVLPRLSLDDGDQQVIIESIVEEFKTRDLNAAARPKPRRVSETPSEVALEAFEVISDWYHFAILELTYVEDFNPDPVWIAKRLGITTLEARIAVARLMYCGLLAEVDGQLVKTQQTITTADKSRTTPALKKNFAQQLEKANASMHAHPLHLRNMTGMTIPTDPEKLTAARQMTAEFVTRLCDFLSSGRKTTVYQLSIALFPIQTVDMPEDSRS